MTSPTAEHSAILCVPPDHPCLAGHFPGRPIVPAVVMLDAVLEEAQRWLGRPLRVDALPQAKFIAPLLPGQRAVMHLRLSGQALRFSLARTSPIRPHDRTSRLQGISRPEAAQAPMPASMTSAGHSQSPAHAAVLIAQGLFHIRQAADDATHETAGAWAGGTPR